MNWIQSKSDNRNISADIRSSNFETFLLPGPEILMKFLFLSNRRTVWPKQSEYPWLDSNRSWSNNRITNSIFIYAGDFQKHSKDGSSRDSLTVQSDKRSYFMLHLSSFILNHEQFRSVYPCWPEEALETQSEPGSSPRLKKQKRTYVWYQFNIQ